MNIRKARESDARDVVKIYESAKASMRASGIDQWQDGYPNAVSFCADVEIGMGIVVEENGVIIATAAAYTGHDSSYDSIYEGNWLTSNTEYGLIHRIAVSPLCKRGGIASAIFRYVDGLCEDKGITSARCDTHRDNAAMQKALKKNGYQYCGIIYLEDGGERFAYEKVFTGGTGRFTTESRCPQTMNIDSLTLAEKAALMNRLDREVPAAVEGELNSITALIEKTTEVFKNGGRIIYCGAGTSGRLGILDAVEIRPTFSVPYGRIIPLMAGGAKNYGEAGEGDEDSEALGRADASALGLTPKDILIGIAASGRTPYVIGALKAAAEGGAETAAIACNKESKIGRHANYKVEIDCGPEFITGSTRLKAGTAQKLVLNMISTLTMAECGKTYGNLMVDVHDSNAKLHERWKRIVSELSGCTMEEAEQLSAPSRKEAKAAIIMYKLKIGYDEAAALLHNNNGMLRAVIG